MNWLWRWAGSLLILNLLLSLGAESEKQARKIINKGGWKIPGRQLATGSPNDRRDVKILDRVVKVESFSVRGRESRETTTGELTVIATSADHVTLQQILVTASRVDRYSYDGRVFCYYVMVSPVDDGKQKFGGVAAIRFELAYYDDDGDGKYEVLEFPDPILRAGQTALRVRLPKWLGSDHRPSIK